MKQFLWLFPILLCAFTFKDVGFIGSLSRPAAGGGGGGGLTFFATNSSAPGGSGEDVSVTVNSVPAGALVVIGVSFFLAGNSDEHLIAVTGDGTLTSARREDVVSGNFAQEWFYKLSSTGGNTTWTAAFTLAGSPATVSFREIHVYVYSVSGGTVSLDSVNSAESAGGSSAVASGNITTTASANVAFAAYQDDLFGTVTDHQINGTAGTHRIDNSLLKTWDLLSAATYTGEATATSSVSTWLCNLVSFKFVP